MAEHNDLGKWGEDEAALYLEDEGYTIIDRDLRTLLYLLNWQALESATPPRPGYPCLYARWQHPGGGRGEDPYRRGIPAARRGCHPRQDEESCHSCQCLCQGMPGGQRVAFRCHLHRGKRTSGEESAASQGCLQSDAHPLRQMLTYIIR